MPCVDVAAPWFVTCRELMRSVGEAGEIEPETESFLVENDIEFGDFPPEALECLPRQTPWTIPQVVCYILQIDRMEVTFRI